MKGKILLKVSDDNDQVGYLSLPNHPGPTSSKVVFKQIDLSDIVQYKGPAIYLNLDRDDNIIGIEIVG
ncbi:MAG: DUF2283 domain-containing protein [Saprospiraceae bacterium]